MEDVYPIRIETESGEPIDQAANVESAESVLYGDLSVHPGVPRRVLAPAGLVPALQHAAETNADCFGIPVDVVVNLDAFGDDRTGPAGYRCPRCRSFDIRPPHGYRLACCWSCNLAFDTMGDDDPHGHDSDLVDGAALEYRELVAAGGECMTLENLAARAAALGYRLDVDPASTCAMGFYANRGNARHYLAFGVSFTDTRTGLGFAHVDANRDRLPELQEIRRNAAILHQGALVET